MTHFKSDIVLLILSDTSTREYTKTVSCLESKHQLLRFSNTVLTSPQLGIENQIAAWCKNTHGGYLPFG